MGVAVSAEKSINAEMGMEQIGLILGVLGQAIVHDVPGVEDDVVGDPERERGVLLDQQYRETLRLERLQGLAHLVYDLRREAF